MCLSSSYRPSLFKADCEERKHGTNMKGRWPRRGQHPDPSGPRCSRDRRVSPAAATIMPGIGRTSRNNSRLLTGKVSSIVFPPHHLPCLNKAQLVTWVQGSRMDAFTISTCTIPLSVGRPDCHDKVPETEGRVHRYIVAYNGILKGRRIPTSSVLVPGPSLRPRARWLRASRVIGHKAHHAAT